MKKILSLLLCATLCMGIFAACTDPETPGTDSQQPAGSSQITGTDTSSNSDSGSSDQEPVTKPQIYDPTIEHKIIIGDIYESGHGIGKAKLVVLDLNECDGDWIVLTTDSAVVWEWSPLDAAADSLARTAIKGFSDAKYRYSELYGKYVVIACNSAGWFGIIDYETKDVLWESYVNNGPHSIELMPNGDLVMVGSGGGADGGIGSVYYYPLSVTDSTKPSSVLPLSSAHGVQWDPDMKVLWVVYMNGIEAVNVAGYGTANASVQILDDMGATFTGDSSGHDLAPVAGSPKEYWVTAVNYVWKFNTETGKLSKSFVNSSAISKRDVKGIASFKDGTIVTTAAGISGHKQELSYDYTTYDLNIVTITMSTGKVQQAKANKAQVTFDEREFYKVHAFDAAYKP